MTELLVDLVLAHGLNILVFLLFSFLAAQITIPIHGTERNLVQEFVFLFSGRKMGQFTSILLLTLIATMCTAVPDKTIWIIFTYFAVFRFFKLLDKLLDLKYDVV